MALCTFFLGACATQRAPAPADTALEPLAELPARPPDELERSTRSLAAAVLLGDREGAAAARRRIELLDGELRAADEPPSGLAPYAQDAENATLPDPRAFRAAQRELLGRNDLSPRSNGASRSR
jgi:hypothetical protein